MGGERSGADRLISLDQFRGFAVLGMFAVNFLGHFHVTPDALKHHAGYDIDGRRYAYVTYADAVMPQFFLAAGFSCRLTLLRRLTTEGPRAAYLRTARRCLGLLLIGLLVYHLDGGVRTWEDLRSLGLTGFLRTAFQRNFFQTLVHLGLRTLWVLPVVASGPRVRIGFAVFSGVLHVLVSSLGYYDWVMKRPGIDGGPLGFMTWTVPFLAGTLAYDLMLTRSVRTQAVRLVTVGMVLMALGYGLSCLNRVTPPNSPSDASTITTWLVEPPLMPPSAPANLWTMSQRAGSLSYHTFAAGFALVVYALFVVACDHGGYRLGLLQTLGQNALAAYLIHDLVDGALKPYMPKDAPGWFVLIGFAGFTWVCLGIIRLLERNRIYLRL
jgi:predicted acyltransferase